LRGIFLTGITPYATLAGPGESRLSGKTLGPTRDRVLEPDASMTFTIGIISDTHGLLRSKALGMLAHVDHTIHGGDLRDAGIITAPARIALLRRSEGTDMGAWTTPLCRK
jgi:hypothetical protein